MIAAAKVRLPWGALHVETAGAGTPLLLVSGLNGLAAPWHGIMPALAGNFRVIAHDHRGLGGSDGWQGPWSVDQIASDVIGLMDGLGIARAHLVGHSLGGAAVQAIAADHPERVAGLVIYASWTGPDPYFARVMRMRQTMLRGLGIEEFLRTGPIGIYPPRWIATHDAAFEKALPSAIAAFPGTDIMLARMEACLAHDRRGSLGSIKAPCLVLGLEDDMSTPAHCSHELAGAIPGARLHMLPMGGHNAHLVVPEAITSSLRDFLATEAPRSRLTA